ncbi:hypothetical protein J6590_071378 [Homalodisca vitripennis]|nr:hypothetical protein J6590_071378 [Homalodisca vitripennis]
METIAVDDRSRERVYPSGRDRVNKIGAAALHGAVGHNFALACHYRIRLELYLNGIFHAKDTVDTEEPVAVRSGVSCHSAWDVGP